MTKTYRIVLLCIFFFSIVGISFTEVHARQLTLSARAQLRPVNWPAYQKLWFAPGPYWTDEWEQGVQSGTLDQNATLRIWNTNRTADFTNGFIRFERAGDVKEGTLAHDMSLCVVNTASSNKMYLTFMGGNTVEFGYDGCVMKGTIAQDSSLRTSEGKTTNYPRGTIVDFNGSGQVTRVVLPAGATTGVDGTYWGQCSIPGIGIFQILFTARAGVFTGGADFGHLSFKNTGNYDSAGVINNGIVTGWVDDDRRIAKCDSECCRWTIRGPITGTLTSYKVTVNTPDGRTRSGMCGVALTKNPPTRLSGSIVSCPSPAKPVPPHSPTPPPPSQTGSGIGGTQWKVNNHPVPWVFHEDGTVEAPGLWKGRWTGTKERVDMTLTHMGATDSFWIKFADNMQSFTAYKNGQVYRNGVRFGGNTSSSNNSRGHRYALTEGAGNWNTANGEAIRKGGHLVVIDSAEENNWLVSTFGDGPFWIGLLQNPRSAEPAGGWHWVNNAPLSYTNWESGQPDNYTSRDNYGFFLKGSGGRWHDVPIEGWPANSSYRGIIEFE